MTYQSHPKKRRRRAKGFDWLGGHLLNPKRSLGYRAPGVPEPPFVDVPFVLERGRRGGTQHTTETVRLGYAMEIEGRFIAEAICRHGDTDLDPETKQALDLLSWQQGSDLLYEEALHAMTGFRSPEAHRAYARLWVDNAVKSRRWSPILRKRLELMEVFRKGLMDAENIRRRQSEFKKKIRANKRPSPKTMFLTFLPFLLKDNQTKNMKQLLQSCHDDSFIREKGDVTLDDMMLIAEFGGINPSRLYGDYNYLSNLFDLVIYRGRVSAFRYDVLSAENQVTYRAMTARTVADPRIDERLWPEWLRIAEIVRRNWHIVPGLEALTAQYGRLQ